MKNGAKKAEVMTARQKFLEAFRKALDLDSEELYEHLAFVAEAQVAYHTGTMDELRERIEAEERAAPEQDWRI